MEIILLTLAYYHGVKMPTWVWIILGIIAIGQVDIRFSK